MQEGREKKLLKAAGEMVPLLGTTWPMKTGLKESSIKKIGEEAGLRNGKTIAKQKMCRDTYMQEVHLYMPEVI